MSTDYFAVCYDCKSRLDEPLASGSIGYGFKVWDSGLSALKNWWTGAVDAAVGAHEGHDIRIVSEQAELPWEDAED